jgi:hypothetical protein
MSTKLEDRGLNYGKKYVGYEKGLGVVTLNLDDMQYAALSQPL